MIIYLPFDRRDTKLIFKKLLSGEPTHTLRPKKVALFPEKRRVKYFLSLTCPHSRMCIRIHIVNFKKETYKKKNKNTKKVKETKEEKKNSSGEWIQKKKKKKKMWSPKWRFFLSPAFPKTRVFFLFLAWMQYVVKFKFFSTF